MYSVSIVLLFEVGHILLRRSYSWYYSTIEVWQFLFQGMNGMAESNRGGYETMLLGNESIVYMVPVKEATSISKL